MPMFNISKSREEGIFLDTCALKKIKKKSELWKWARHASNVLVKQINILCLPELQYRTLVSEIAVRGFQRNQKGT